MNSDRGPPTEAPPELNTVLDHLVWHTAKLPDGKRLPDLGLDKKTVKASFERRALINCSSFLLNAPDDWLGAVFKPRLDEQWRTAMGPKDESERLRYLAARVSAELMRATGIGP